MALKHGKVAQQEVPKEERPVFSMDDGEAPEDVKAEAPPAPEPEVGKAEVVETTAEAEVETEEAPEPEAPEEEVAASSSQEVVVREGGGEMVASTSGQVVQQLAEDGMEGMDLGFGAFPQIVLDDGQFECADLPGIGKDGFECVIQQSKQKFICKTDCADNDQHADFFYTLFHPTLNPHADQVSTNGKPIADFMAEWKAHGMKPIYKKYLEVLVMIFGGDHDGAYAILSVPPTSITRLSGMVAIQKMKHGLRQDQYITKVRVGPKIGQGTTAFKPWVFEAGAKLAEAA